MTVYHSHCSPASRNPPPSPFGQRKQEEAKKADGGKETEATRTFPCKCCAQCAPWQRKERKGGGSRWMDGWGWGLGRVSRCDVRWPELFSDAINIEARFSCFDRGKRDGIHQLCVRLCDGLEISKYTQNCTGKRQHYRGSARSRLHSCVTWP